MSGIDSDTAHKLNQRSSIWATLETMNFVSVLVKDQSKAYTELEQTVFEEKEIDSNYCL